MYAARAGFSDSSESASGCTNAYEYWVNPLAAASSSPRCLGADESRLSMSLRLNGMAWPTRSGSSSEANVVPDDERASPSLLTAKWLSEQAPVQRAARRAARRRTGGISRVGAVIRSGEECTRG